MTSAPTPSQIAATALTNESLVARNALAAYLIVSADAGSVTMTGAATPRYSDDTLIAAAWSVAADDDAVGLQEVLHRRALAQELRVRHDLHVGSVEHPLDDAGRADRHRRLVDDDALVRQVRRDLPGRRLDVGEVGAAVLALRRRHAQERDLAVLDGVGGAEHELEPTRAEPLVDEAVEAVLDDRDLARRQPRDLVGIDVGADHLVAEVGEAGTGREAHVAGSDDGDPRHGEQPTGATSCLARGSIANPLTGRSLP